MRLFFETKLHLIYNQKGELLNFMITFGDADDRKALEYKSFIEFIYSKMVTKVVICLPLELNEAKVAILVGLIPIDKILLSCFNITNTHIFRITSI